MAKQEKDYQCVPIEQIAMLLTQGVGYDGYIEFSTGHKLYVAISQNSNVAIDERYIPQDTILSVQIFNRDNPPVTESTRFWTVDGLRRIQNINSGVGLTAGIIENSQLGAMRIMKNGNISLKYYHNGWAGGSRAKIKTYKVVTKGTKDVAHGAGKLSFVFGAIMDVGLAEIGEQSPHEAIVNTTFSDIGTFRGPAGLIIYGLYFGLDLVGAFDGPTHVAPQPKDPIERYTQPAGATRVERIRHIEPIQKQKPIYIPREQPVLKQGYKK